MDIVLSALDSAFDFVDDILISSSSPEEHLDDLRALFTRLAEHGFVINPVKYVFGQPELSFLSHTVQQEFVHTSRQSKRYTPFRFQATRRPYTSLLD